jgi:hypothetical protein
MLMVSINDIPCSELLLREYNLGNRENVRRNYQEACQH